MDQSWKTHIISLVLINIFLLISCSPLEGDDSLNFSDDFVYPDLGEQNEIAKRLSSFVRIGRGLSSFIRIGRNDPEFSIYEAVPGEDNSQDDGEFQKRKSAFVRIGRGGEPDVDNTLSSWRSGYGTEPLSLPFNKRGGAFIRLGKFPSAGFVRNRSGRIHSISSPPYYRRSGRIGHSSFIRIGKRDTTNALKQMGIKDMNEEELRKYLVQQEAGTLNEGDESIDNAEKEPNEKRMSSFVRIGRQMSGDYSTYEYNRQHNKQQQNADIDEGQTEKRMSSFVRIGRQMSGGHNPNELALILNGHSPQTKDTNSQNTNKRMSSFVRIGKNFDDFGNADKRMSSFVRIGKNDINTLNNAEEKRMSKFVRIGRPNLRQTDKNLEDLAPNDKRMSKFVRIGKAHYLNLNELTGQNRIEPESGNGIPLEDLALKDKRMSKFVRIGRPHYENPAAYFRKPQNGGINNQRTDTSENDIESTEKRFSKFVRIGKDVTIPDNMMKVTDTESNSLFESVDGKGGEDNTVQVIQPVSDNSDDLVKVTDEN